MNFNKQELYKFRIGLVQTKQNKKVTMISKCFIIVLFLIFIHKQVKLTLGCGSTQNLKIEMCTTDEGQLEYVKGFNVTVASCNAEPSCPNLNLNSG